VRKLFLFLLVPFLFLNASQNILAEEDNVSESAIVEELPEDEVEQSLTEQLELIQNIIVALAVSFVGTSTFGVLVRYTFRKIIAAAEERIKQAEKENIVTQETAKLIYENIDVFEKLVQSQLKDLLLRFNEMDKSYKELLAEFQQRDAKLKELVEENFKEE